MPLSLGRTVLKIFHPQGIPWPGSVLYNRLSRSRIFQRHYAMVAEDIARRCPEGKLLDIGTGPGWLLLALHRRCPALRTVGVDISRAMVAKARWNVAAAGLSDAIDIREAPAGHLPFPDNAFDVVVSTGAMHHWKDPAAGLNEVYRVLKGGGIALMYDLVTDTPAENVAQVAREFGRLRAMLFRLHSFEEPFCSVKDFVSLAHATRFKEGQARFVGLLCCLTLRKGEGPS